MDALEFLKERKRMCNSYGHCEGCPLEEVICALDQTDSVDGHGVLMICPAKLFKAHRNSSIGCKNTGKLCIDCRREFCNQEVE